MAANDRSPVAKGQDRDVLASRSFNAHEEVLGKRLLQWGAVIAAGAAVGLGVAHLPVPVIAAILFGIACVAIVLRKPFIGLLLYATIYELRPGELYPILAPLRLERVIGTMTLVAIFLAQYRQTGTILLDSSRQSKLLLLFVISVLASVPTAYWRLGALDGFSTMAKALAYYLMVLYLIDSRKRLKWFLGTYAILILYLAGTSLHLYFTGRSHFAQGIQRAVGATSASNNPNFLGTTIASVFPLFLLLTASRPFRWWRPLLFLACALLAYTMILTGSRASMLGFLAGLAYLWMRSRHRLHWGVFGIVLMVATFLALPDEYKQRYATITSGEVDASTNGRLLAWGAGLRMFVERPLFGVGINNFIFVRWEYDRVWLDVHSLYFQVLAELGLMGTVAFFAFIAETLRMNRQTSQELSMHEQEWEFERKVLTGLLAGFIALLIGGIFGTHPLRRAWYVFAATGLVVARLHLASLQKESSIPEETHLRESKR